MKTKLTQAGPARSARGMTLVEIMTTSGLFTLVVAGLLAVNMFGLKQDELLNSQIGASDQSRENFNLMIEEIRSGKQVLIGTGSSTNFSPITNAGVAQQGDTIEIWPSTNIDGVIYYYFYTNSALTNGNWLVRVSVQTNTTTGVVTCITNTVATSIYNVTSQWQTNALNFSAVVLNGTNWVVLTNDPATTTNYNYLVTALLQFYQYQYPLTYVGTNCLYDYYQINLQAARRAL
jgi:hypothetical protein